MIIEHSAIRRGRQTVVRPGRVEIPQKGITGLVGINGAGKSTLMLHLAGVLAGAPDPRHVVAYAPQRPSFPTWRDARGIARMFGFSFGTLKAQFPTLLLHEIEQLAGGKMSVGQMQTLSIALALGLDAPLTLLDEPFAPLDFRRRVCLTEMLVLRSQPDADAASAHGPLLISSQSAAELIDVCTWVVVMRDGRYVFAGSVAELAGSGDADQRRRHLEQALLSLMQEDATRPAEDATGPVGHAKRPADILRSG